MEIHRDIEGDTLVLKLSGRLDAAWAGAVDAAIDAAIRDGRHTIHLDLAGVDYISSAGLRVLLSHFKQLRGIGGCFVICNACPAVAKVIEMSGLGVLFSEDLRGATKPTVAVENFETANAQWERYGGLGDVSVRTVGGPSAFDGGEGQLVEFSCDRFGVGIGSLATGEPEGAGRWGELVAAGGCAAHLPPGGTGRADFASSEGRFVPAVWMGSGLFAEGTPDRLLRFEASSGTGRVGMTEVAKAAMNEVGGSCAFILIAESAGLVGVSLRRSPDDGAPTDPFEFPNIREWLDFSAEQIFRDGVALVVGVVAPQDSSFSEWLRPCGDGTMIHAHAAAFPYRPVPKGRISLNDSIAKLFEFGGPQSVLHLLNDDREPDGVGESMFTRGACWVARARMESTQP